jgi:hypothetical protein
MIDFLITALLDESICTPRLERCLHRHGISCPDCASPERQLFREQGHFPLRQRIRADLNGTGPTDAIRGTAFEADELYQMCRGVCGAPDLPARLPWSA